MKRVALAIAVFLGAAVQAVPAAADVTYTLDCNSVACGTQTNYGSVTLHPFGSGTGAGVHVTVDLTTASATETFVGTGAGYAVNWNISGNPNLSVTNITPATGCPLNCYFQLQDNAAGGTTNGKPNFSYKASPFGSNWMYAIDYGPNGSTGTDNKLQFDVTKSGGLVLTDFVAADGFYFAVDIFRDNNTFVVASNTFVPEPGTWMMLIAGMGLMFMMQRRRRGFVRAA
jgi:hypothetical protein